jgi:hypothetical protein
MIRAFMLMGAIWMAAWLRGVALRSRDAAAKGNGKALDVWLYSRMGAAFFWLLALLLLGNWWATWFMWGPRAAFSF